LFKEEPTHYFSSPGRTELSGNHTDHNHGFVLAASINLDSVACVAKEDSMIKIFSEGYKKPFVINLGNLKKLKKEAGTTNSLIRGIASGFKEKGYNIGGFNAVIGSDVLQGSGLSSSASIEILIGTIFNTLYNNGKILPEEIAKIGQDAENIYFEKSCGLMDQMACAVGGIISIDFYDPLKPKIKKINFDFTRQKYSLVFVHTGGSHISLTKDYEAIPNEMKEVAVQFGKKYCSEIDFKDFFHRIKKLRKEISDRAILRCYHFFKENERVKNQIKALQKNDFNNFLFFVNDSGNSSYKYLQNIYSSVDPHFQPISIALAFTENFINKIGKGACRIHGGGFEGTIQVLIDNKYVDQFIKYISNISDNFKVLNLNIREFGSTEVIMK
jgi:galactokinase